MRSLGPCSRALLAAVAFAAFAGSFVTTPIVAHGAAAPPTSSTPGVRPLPALSAVAAVLPRRDPFAGDAPVVASSAAAHAAGIPSLPALPALPAALRPLPPNAGAGNGPSPFAAPLVAAPAARVTAVVTGAHPFALVEDAGSTRLVTVGDRISGDTIAAITADGIRLARGTVLAVAPASPPNRSDPGGR